MLTSILIYLALITNDQISLRTTNFQLLGGLFCILFAITYIGRIAITLFALRRTRRKEWHFNTLIAGTTDKAIATADKLISSQSALGHHISGFIKIDGEPDVDSNQLPAPIYNIQDLNEIVKKLNISQIILSPQDLGDKNVLNLINTFYPLDISVKIAPGTLSFITSGIRLQDIYGEPFVDLTSPSISESTINVKRTIDVIVAIAALIVLAIPMAIIAALVKNGSRGPVFYKQERIGFRKKPFTIYKFRTMRIDAEVDGPRLSETDDPRITPIGKILRKYRIDELPQFWNILRGDMSLVGPRPERRYYIDKILEKAPYYTLLHQVRPGLTSWGMVKYGYASSISQMVERAKFDLVYLSNMSTAVDMKILIYTIKTVATGKGK
jgi:exopolysaccharide biosynthesis polyprenyl glycosylphosphotransferase